MSETAIGGYWASLELKTKEKTFKDGIRNLKEVGKSVKSFASFAIKAFSLTGGGLLALTATTASYESRNLMLASSLRMSAGELVAWRGAANLMGVSAEGLTGALLELQKKSDRIKLGEVDVGLAKSLGMLGIGYQNFLKQDSASKMKTVFEKAMQMSDKGKAGELIRDILGDAGKEMFQYMQMTGQSLNSILAKSKALMFTTDSTRKKAMIFNQEFKATFASVKEMGSLFFSTFGGAMTPVLVNMQNFIIKNKALISTGIIKFATALAKIGKEIFKVIQIGVPFVAKLITKMGGLEKVLKIVVISFASFKALQIAGSVASITAALTGLSKIKIAGGLLAFAALFLIIQDIAMYSKYGAKGANTLTGSFVTWLDTIGEKTHWVKDLSDSLKILFGQIEDVDISKLSNENLIGLSAEKAGKGKTGWEWFKARNKAGKATEELIALLELQGKKKWNILDQITALTLGVKQGEPESFKREMNKLELILKVEGAEGVIKEIRARYNGEQIQKGIIKK